MAKVRKPQSAKEREVTSSIGRRIASLRLERGLTQTQLAQSIGSIQAVISSYEVGRVRPHADVLAKLAEALGVTIDTLILFDSNAQKAEETPQLDRRFARRLRNVHELSRRDQDALLRTIDAFLAMRRAPKTA